MKKLTAFLLLIFLLMPLFSCAKPEIPADTGTETEDTAVDTEDTEPSADPEKDKRILVIETSDIHGYIMDATSQDESKFQYRLAYIAQVVNDARDSGEWDGVLLLDAGDIYQGMPVSNLSTGAPLRAAFDAMGYDAVCLGNHEFDWGVELYCADPDATLPAYEVGEFRGDPDIPILACNIYFTGTAERVPFTKDYVIIEKAGVRIAVIGYVQDYSNEIMRDMISPYRIDGSIVALKRRISEIKEGEKPDVTVLLAHRAAAYLAAALDPGEVQLVMGGHDHGDFSGVSKTGVSYMQPNCYAQSYASAALIIAPNGKVTVEDPSYTVITQNKDDLYDFPGNAGKLDPDVLAISRSSWDAVGEQLSEVLGYIETPIEKHGIITGNTTSGGNFITGLMLRATAKDGVVAAFYNTGGFRADMKIPYGSDRRLITVGDVYAMAPFGNTWLIFDLTGQELAQQLVNGFRETGFGDQMSGLTFTYYNHGTDEEPEIEIVSITLDDGTEVDINGTEPVYRVCTSSYSASKKGGVFENKTSLYPESEALIDNVTMIYLLRQEAVNNNGYIEVDTSPRSFRLEEEASEPAA